MTTTTKITAQVKAKYGEDPTDELANLIGEGFRVVDAFTWSVGPNWGGESPQRIGFVINLEKR